MAEGELVTGIDGDDDESTSPWSALPEEVQRMVLSRLPIKSLFQMRCVCKEWRQVLHRRDFRAMYDTVNESQEQSPAICYVESSDPARLVLSTYDFAAKRWERMSGFTSCPPLKFPSYPLQPYSWPRNFYSVGGLVCLYFWKTSDSLRGESSWVVWQPFRNIWKKLPPSCNQMTRNRGACFIHAWVSDEGAKTYKLLMAHDPRRWEDITRGTLVTEIYDSATGAWTHGTEELSFRSSEPHSSARHIRRGVLCNGIIYFCSGSLNSVLLSYDIHRDQWHEEVWNRNCVLIFEWDGRLMSITSSNPSNFVSAFHEEDRLYVVEERNPNSGMWTETGIDIPLQVRRRFHNNRGAAITVVARGNDLAMTGYAEDDSFKIAVYKRAEDHWWLPPTGTFSNKLRSARVEGLVLHKPQLDWVPRCGGVIATLTGMTS